jgi:argininosuccinate lyase
VGAAGGPRPGPPPPHAHGAVGRIVLLAEERGVGLEDLTVEDLRSVCPEADEAVAASLDARRAVESRLHVGGTAPDRVRKECARWRSELLDGTVSA